MNTQLKKGALELCVLAVLHRQDCYGYELVSKISHQVDITEGTIYPLLRRLKNDGLLTTYLKESSGGPPRKYYQITEEGIRMKAALVEEWDAFVTGVNLIVKEGDPHV